MPSPACRSSMLVTIVALLAATLTGARSLANPPSEIAKKVMPSVVLITIEDDQGEALARGSGFVVAEGVIATNLHVIRGASRAFVKVVNSETQLEVLGVVAENNEWDLVLLAVKDLTAPPLPLGDSTALQVGDDVYAVGNPHGLEGTFSAGIVSSIRRLEGDALLQITAPISPGSSGGPIVNKDAEVVGVAVASLMEGQNLNFAISSSYLGPMVKTRKDPKHLPGTNQEEPRAEREVSAMDSELLAWIIARADNGDVDSMYHLGIGYTYGWGMAQDYHEAARWFRKGADAEHPRSMYMLGEMYEYGRGRVQDDEAAAKWFRKAADLGEAAAMFRLGVMYANGRGVPHDDVEAVRWYRKAAGAGSSWAMFNLGLAYTNGVGVPMDDLIAIEWFTKAADLNHAASMYNLGVMYADGRGVAQNNSIAVKWYHKAADAGNSWAMFNLGLAYANGVGVPVDEREAAKWYRKAAELGVTAAMRNVGIMFADGNGVAQSDIEAYVWFSVAAACGDKRAGELRDIVATNLTAEARLTAQARAKEYFERIEKTLNE